MASLLRFSAFLILAASTFAAPLQCPRCPLSDNIGESLVAQSGGSLGTPLFCGYSLDTTGASGPQTTCFYGSSGGVFSGGANCPSSAVLDC